MDWPDLVKALKPLGFREGHEGHWMFSALPDDSRRVLGGFDGQAVVVPDWAHPWRPLFSGPYAEVAEYLKGGQSNDGA